MRRVKPFIVILKQGKFKVVEAIDADSAIGKAFKIQGWHWRRKSEKGHWQESHAYVIPLEEWFTLRKIVIFSMVDNG